MTARKLTSFLIEPDLLLAVKVVAAAANTSYSEVVRTALRDYLAGRAEPSSAKEG
jgi:hypothetical protein